MMKNYTTILILLCVFIISCTAYEPMYEKGKVLLKIENTEIKCFFNNVKEFEKRKDYDYDRLVYKIENNTNRDLAIPIDTSRFTVYDDSYYNNYDVFFSENHVDGSSNNFDKQRYQLSILTKDSLNNLGEVLFIGNIDEYFKELPSLKEILKTNLFILKKGEALKVTKKITLPINIIKKGDVNNRFILMFVDLYTPRNDYNFELFMKIDSNNVKKNLSQEKLNFLQKNNIKIFHGTLKSNKTPINCNN